MGTVPSLRTWTAGEIVTAAYMNTNVRDAGNFMIGQPIAELFQGTLQSIPNSAFTAVTFDSSTVDTDGGHSNVTNNSRYTGKTPGWFQFGGGVSLVANATGFRGTQWAKNGSAVGASDTLQNAGAATFNTNLPARLKLVQLNGTTDYVELQAFQSSGGALNTGVAGGDAASMSVHWIHS